MAQRVITQLVSDLSGADIAEGEGRTVEFSVSGVEYRLDLTNKEADKFDSAMDFYITHATKTGGRAKRGSGGPKKNTKTAEIKAWAESQGIDYPQRGRLPQSLVDQYDAAN